MSHYQHILLAADFTEHGKEVANKAKELAEMNQASLSIIHVLDNIPMSDAAYGPIIPFDGDLSKQLMDAAEKHLEKFSDDLNIPKDKQWLECGSPKLEIVRVAVENQVDLIVVGSHGRHGLALLLGSTANGVLHHAICDVLAVRLHDD
jgi:universal stress protein A